MEKAFGWIIEGRDYTHSVELPWETRVAAELVEDEESGSEKLVLNALGKKGIVPRSVDRHHGVSTNYKTFFNLVIHVGQRDDPVFDRGVIWINVSSPDSPKLSLTLMPNEYTVDQLKEQFSRMTERVLEVFGDILGNEAK